MSQLLGSEGVEQTQRDKKPHDDNVRVHGRYVQTDIMTSTYVEAVDVPTYIHR